MRPVSRNPNKARSAGTRTVVAPDPLIGSPGIGLPSTWPGVLLLAARSCQYDANAYVFHRGQPVQAVYQIQAGRLLLRRDEANGESITLQTAGPGDFIAEASLFTSRYHCDAFCPEACQLLVLPAKTVLTCLQSESSFALDWIRLLSQQLTRSRAREERLSLRSPRERILHCLRLESDDQGVFILPGRLMQWARTLGMTHETLYRTLARLERDDLIVRHGSRIALA
jgi:CRP-like cAMP-binding protein